MNVFVIGTTNSGKTTLSSALSTQLNFKHIQISKILKEQNAIVSTESYNQYIHRLTEVAKIILRTHPDFFVDYIKKEASENNIIEGCRNIRDFMLLFNPKTDVVIHVIGSNGITEFESEGLHIIIESVNFMSKTFNSLPLITYFPDKTKSIQSNLKSLTNLFYEHTNRTI